MTVGLSHSDVGSSSVSDSLGYRGGVPAPSPSPTGHRIRHSRRRNSRAQSGDGDGDDVHRRSPNPPAGIPSQLRRPDPDFEPRAYNGNRSQRSPKKNKSKNNRKRRARNCQEQDVPRKAFLADYVVLAKAQAMSSNRRPGNNYSVSFAVVDQLKGNEPLDLLRLHFTYDRRLTKFECEPTKRNSLVKADIKKNREYILFLRIDEQHDYHVYGTPITVSRSEKKKRRQLATTRRVCSTNFGEFSVISISR